jgi:hypothetical protein
MKTITRGRTLPVLLATVALVGAANLGAYAATGRPLVLGGPNTESATTTVTNSGAGPALTLHTSRKSPPLAVSSGKVVKHLNADRVDGVDAADLGAEAFTYLLPNGPTQDSLKMPPRGTYLVTISAELSDSSQGQCWIEENGGVSVAPITIFGSVIGGYNTVTGSTVVSLTKKVTDMNFRCLSPIHSTKVNPSTVSLIRIATHRTGHIFSRTHTTRR